MNKYFQLEKKPLQGLMAVEWVALAYLLATTLFMFFTYVKLHNPESMLMGRVRVVAITAAMWLVYRLLPCRLTRYLRVVVQLLLLSWWYADTYELNRVLPSLDHVVAGWEQQLFGCQPAMLFAQHVPWGVVSELMCLGYSSFMPLMLVVLTFYFLFRYDDFQRVAFSVVITFFVCYAVFVVFPVAGPSYYYPAAGLEAVARGELPDLHDHFATLRDALPVPGWSGGLFHQSVADARAVGERATGGFPSLHAALATLLTLLSWRTRNRRFFWLVVPFSVLLCLSTVYLGTHYVVSILAGAVLALVVALVPIKKS